MQSTRDILWLVLAFLGAATAIVVGLGALSQQQ